MVRTLHLKDHRARISAEDIIAAPDLDMVVPCRDESRCGWDVETKPGKTIGRKRAYYGLAVAIDKQAGNRPLFVNRARFDFDTPVHTQDGKNQLYCDYRAKNCRDRIVFY